ncbi:sugar ABC transporter substrate-binding protein [Leifsonia sp. AG29]|uniref:sugar ABC transporter substrate-binding protein n=1 Tax=Leifsonia sp. AG29 TaxID=2598860 RepID=UPI00131DA8FC|nr:extracellular solute-binding protein [Leifsonia sp. AG29]
MEVLPLRLSHSRRELGDPRRRRRARAVALGAIAAAVSLVLAGCVGSGSGAESTQQASWALPAKDVTTTLKLWNYQSSPQEKQWWNAAVDSFKKEYPNVTIQTTIVPYASMTSKLLGSGVSKSIPDGVLYNPADSAKLYEAGIIQDITRGWSGFADKAKFPSSVIWKSGDKVLSVQGYINTTAIWYNKTILDKAGVSAPPKTIEEFGQALAAVKKAGFNGFLLSGQPNGSGEFDFLPWLYAYGQNYGKFDKATVEKVFAQFGQWIDAGYIPRDITNNNEGDNGNIFANGQYAFVQNGNWNLKGARSANYSFEWGVSDFPTGPSGAHGIGGGEGFSVGAGTKYPALVYKFFEHMLLNKQAQLDILAATGSLPVRSDAAEDPAIQSNPDLTVYAKVVKDLGSRPNTPKVSDFLNTMGKIWNSFAGGSISASEAADQVVSQLNNP